MRIAKLITLNWGTIESREWEFRDATLLTGESGSGKSTLLDAVQAVLTAARTGLFQFNAGQNESTQSRRGGKEPRTLHSYALGQTGNDIFVRGRATCYAALVFEATANAGEHVQPFTAILGVEAQEESGKAVGPKPVFFIVRRALTFQQMLKAGADEGKNEPLPLKELYLQLQHRLGVGAETVFRFEGKDNYLQHLYGALVGKTYVSEQDASRCAKALVKAMAYKEIGNVNDLVRDEILEEKDFSADVTKMRQLMQEMARLKGEAERLRLNIDRLRAVDGASTRTVGEVRKFVVAHVAHAARLHDEAETELSAVQRRIEVLGKRSQLSGARLERMRNDQAQLVQQLDVVKGQLASSDVARQKQALDIQAGQHAEQFRKDWNLVRQCSKNVEALLAKVEQLLTIDVSAVPTLQVAVDGMRVAADSAIRQWAPVRASLQADATLDDDLAAFEIEPLDIALEQVERALRGEQSSLLSAVIEALGDIQLQKSVLESEQGALDAELVLLQAGRSPAPEDVNTALTLLEKELPQARPRILASLVEPKKGSTWQKAIEGYMGRDRFSIIVEPEHEAQSVRLVKRRFPKRSPKVVQGSKAVEDTRQMTLAQTAVLHEIDCRHPVAKAYLLAQYGRVRKVDSEEGLRRTAQGLMERGVGSRGYGMFACMADERDLAFGMETRQRRLDWVRGRLDFLAKELSKFGHLQSSLRLVSGWFTGAAAMSSIAPVLEEALSTRLKYQTVRSALDAMDTSSIDALVAERASLEGRLETSAGEYDKEMKAVGVQEDELKREHLKQDQLALKLPKLQLDVTNSQVWVSRFASAASGIATEVQLLDEAYQLSNHDEPSTATLKSHIDSGPSAISSALQLARVYVDTYLSGARTDEERFLYPDPPKGVDKLERILSAVLDLQVSVREQIRRQDSIGLAENVAKLESAEVQFNSVFTTSFCFKVRDDVRTGLATLAKLNKELRTIQFGYDSYELVYEWIPRFQKYFEFFEAVDGMVDTLEKDKVSIFDSPKLSDAHRDTANSIKGLLLSQDQVASEKALKELADYRNYRRYDINRIVAGHRTPMSTWGTGSGGELETPFYVIRSAVLAHALGHFGRDKGAPALRLMLSDEAFSKMDESRSRAVLRFLATNMGMQLLVAMPTSKSGAIKPEFDKEYTFSKIEAVKGGKTLHISEVQEKDLKRKALGDLWDAHAHAARLGARADYELANKQVPAIADSAAEPEVPIVVEVDAR
ncbi:ArsR family transcriptional regulator [Variovorax paradoxus]|nr:ATP-binding protein [Variovorax paradoxus]MBT2304545.1 ArsR family transcriptional regulator [Variovorax paradoxus]